ncbi:MAG: sterol desaturase family protein [Chitinophagales bacterium]
MKSQSQKSAFSLKDLWSNQFLKFKKGDFNILTVLVFLIGISYVLLEVLIIGIPDGGEFVSINIFNYKSEATLINPARPWLSRHFTKLWIGVAVLCMVIRFTVIVSSYFLSRKKYDKDLMVSNTFTYASAFVISMLTGLAFVALLSLILKALGFSLGDGLNVFDLGAHQISILIDKYVPTIFQVNNYWVAIALAIVFAGLPTYFVHWLSHVSRFCWLVFHRCHHCPEYLHPIAAPPAFSFDFFLIIPKAIVVASVAKLFYAEPLIMEMSLYFLAGYSLEIFNHSIVHYNFAEKNIIVRNLCRLYGDKGVYHLVHHSAFEQDQNVNFSGSPFNLWDRLLGTYRKPYKEAPPIGLTNNPTIYMNPFRIIFSGITQLVYELKMNKSWKVKWKIIFGGVYYLPPETKDFLKVTV